MPKDFLQRIIEADDRLPEADATLGVPERTDHDVADSTPPSTEDLLKNADTKAVADAVDLLQPVP